MEQQRQRRDSKRQRDLSKQIHTHLGIQPPCSPISPSPPQVEIQSVDDRVAEYINSDHYNQYGSMFYPDIGTSSSAPPPTQPDFGFDGASSSQAAGPSEEIVQPSSSEMLAARLSTDLFGYTPPPPYDAQQGEGTGWSGWQ